MDQQIPIQLACSYLFDLCSHCSWRVVATSRLSYVKLSAPNSKYFSS